MSSGTGSNLASQAVSGVQALRERLAKSREERNAKVTATRNARNNLSMSSHPIQSTGIQVISRSPSIAPAEPIPENPVASPSVLSVSEKVHQPLAVPQNSPHDISQKPGLPQIQSSTTSLNSTQASFGSPQLGPAEYVIGLPLRTKCVTLKGIDQKTAYINSIVGKHKEIQRYLADPNSADVVLVQTMQEIVEQSGRIATHPDLPFDKMGISTGAAEKEAEYHAAMSSKFVFLRSFLTAVRQLFLKIVIVAESGKLIDILEIFLRGIKVCYTRLDRLSTLPRIPDDDLDGFVKVFLLPSCKSGAVTNAADCLIAMDSTFDAGLPEIKGFRSSIVEVERLAPVIRLVAINTIEHLRLCCAPGQEIPLHIYIETLKNLRLSVGIATQEYGSAISRAPTKISKWLQRKAEGTLEIPSIPELPLFEPATQVSATVVDLAEVNDKRKRQDDITGTQATDLSVLHPLETKRLRVHNPEPSSSLPTFNQPQGDITHISDSMPSQPLPMMHGEPELTREPEVLASSPMELESEVGVKEEVVLMDDGITFVEITTIPEDLDIEFMSREDLVSAFKKVLGELYQWKDSTGRLQIRHEELRRTLVEVKKDLKQSQKTQKDAKARKDRMSNELAKVKAGEVQLQADLELARNALLAGPPEKARFEQLRAENEKLKERLCAIEDILKARERDFEFVRDQYQQASNGALELKGDNEKLRKENSQLEKKSNDVVVQLRQLQQGNQVQARDKHIENLSLQLREREERIARLEHERAISTRSRGSLGMRASSVSIRGSPIQSRATSPTTGIGFHGRESLTHPLRNG